MRYRLLGPVTVDHGEGEVGLGGRRPRLLLATLLLHPNTPVAGSTLIEGLWRHEPPARAATAVRVVLAQLRRVLEPNRQRGQASILAHGPAGWALSVPPGALDTERFESLVERSRRAHDAGRLTEASELGRAALDEWRGPALVDVVDDLELAQAPARRWEELRLETVERTIETELRLGRHEALTGELSGLVAEYPLREHLVSLLMVALYRGGRQAEALRVYDASRRRLIEELGIEPGPRLVELERAILLQEPVLDLPAPERERGNGFRWTPPLPGAVADVCRAGGLIGREADLARAQPILDTVASGRVVTLVVSGVAGIGKTRFAAEIADSCHRRGAVVLFGRCDREPLLSYQPFVEAFADYLGRLTGDRDDPGSHSARVSGILAALTGAGAGVGGGAATGPGAGDRYLLFESVTALVRELGSGRTLVLVVDDLQWADDGTVALIRHLVRRLGDRSILMLVTTRQDDGVPGVPGQMVLADAERDGELHRLRLGGLGEPAARTVVSQLWTEHERDGVAPVASRVIELAEGNPFFLRHLAAHLAAAGPGAADPGQLSLPTEVFSLVETLVGSLSAAARLVLQIASVQGREFDLDVVGAVTGMDEHRLLDAIEDLLAARLVVEDGAGIVDRYRFTHELVREVSYRQLSPSRRARVHGQVGVALETVDDHQLMVLSHHFSLAGRSEWLKAAGYARRAGDLATAAFDFDTAIVQYERAVRLARQLGRSGPGFIELLINLGCAYNYAGDPVRAHTALAEAIEIARERGRPDLVALASLADSGDGWRGSFDLALGRESVARLAEALADLTDEHAIVRARVATRLASDILFLDGAEAADEASREALRLAREAGDAAALAGALHIRHLALLPTGAPERRLELADEQLRCAARGSYVDVANALWDRTIDVMELGRRDETDAMLGAYRRRFDRGRPPLQWWAEVFAATVATARGDFDEAEAKANAALARGEELGQLLARSVYIGQLFVLRWLQGRLVGGDGSHVGLSSSAPDDIASRAGNALHLAVRGEHEAGVAELRRVLVAYERAPHSYVYLGSLAIAAEAAARIGAAAAGPAAVLLDHLRPYAGRHLVYMPGLALLGPCDRYLGGLLAATGDLAGAATALARARAMAEEAGTEPYARLAEQAEAAARLGTPARSA